MNTALAQIAQPFSFNMLEQMVVVNGAVGRLLLACVLGGAVGLERELNRKSAGVRTNLLICMGAAFFTLLSPVLAGEIGNNKGQVASNIVQGIGFLGAGVIFALAVVGFLEHRVSLKAYPVTYEIRGHDQPQMLQSILDAMDGIRQRLTDIQTDTIGEIQRISFPLAATKRQHERLSAELQARPDIDTLFTFRDPEDD